MNRTARGRQPTAPSVFEEGGELGARMRAYDWSSTPLGAPANWSQSLKIAVRIMLNSLQPVWIGWGKSFIYLYNDAYKPILGGRHPSALGRPAAEVWPETWSEIGPMLQTALNGSIGTYVEAQLLVMERNGYPEETYYTWSYTPIPDADGRPGGIICTNTDDTQRVIDARQLALLRDLATDTADARTVQTVYEQSAKVLATYPHDFPFAMLFTYEPAGGAFSLVATGGIERGHAAVPESVSLDGSSFWPFGEALRTGDSRICDLRSEFGAKLPSGPWRQPPTQAAVVPILSGGQTGREGILVVGLNPFRLYDESFRGFVMLVASQIAAAIANAQAYEDERKRAEALAEIDRAKTAFFSNVSHEFRTPLTLMLGPLEEALENSDLPAAERERLDIAHRNSLRLLKLVNSLLDFSRIEAGRAQATYEPVDLSALTVELASNFRSACERAGLNLVVDCPRLPEPVYVDRDMWEKVVLNLLSNAFKYTFEGLIVVALRASTDEKTVELAVRDTGGGIPAHELPRIFERFHRIEGQKSRTHEGSGIGLALVQELVKLHAGSIRVESEPARGTVFTIAIPFGKKHLPQDRIGAERSLAPSSVQADAYIREALHWLPDAASFPELQRELDVAGGLASLNEHDVRILLADDNADMRRYVSRLLGANCQVQAVPDGEAALAAIRERRPDLLLADIMMPRLDGFGLLRAIRSDPELQDLPVIMLSARAGEESRVEGLNFGADDYLVKPFSARELIARIGSTLELRRVRRTYERRLAADLQNMERLQEVGGEAVRGGDTLRDLLAKALDAAIAITGTDKGNIQIFDSETGALEIVAQRGFEPPFLNFFARVDMHKAASCRAAFQAGERVVVEDVMESRIFAGQPSLDVLLAAGVRAVQSTPLKSSSGKLLGMISTHFSRPHIPNERDLGFINLLARLVGDYLERTQAEEALKQSEERLRNLTATLEQKVRERTRDLETEIFERRKAETALERMQRLEAVGQLTGGIAHDFNNLLMVISAQVEAIARATEGNDRVRRMAETSLRAADRGAQLTSQLLSFAGRQQLRPVATAVDGVLHTIGKILRRIIGENITVKTVPSSEPWLVDLDVGQFESTILNLAINARDAMPTGGRLTLRVDNVGVSTDEGNQLGLAPGDYVAVSVADTGTGMSAEVQLRAFEPFYTTKEVGKGTGLGLSQVYGFARQSGGTATIESVLDKGTTVVVYFPRASGSIEQEQPSLDQQQGRTASQRRRILLVEDQADVREVTEGMLADLGHLVLTVADAVAARRLLEGPDKIDLLLTDVVLPKGMSGIELAREAQRMRPDLKIVLMSGYHRESQNNDTLSGIGFLEKPFRLAQLASAIDARFVGSTEASDQKSPAKYRLLFLDEADATLGHDEFEAEDDASATAIARVLQDACSDRSVRFELWQRERRVDVSSHSESPITSMQANAQTQQVVLERERALFDSGATIAASKRLLAETQRLLENIRSRLP